MSLSERSRMCQSSTVHSIHSLLTSLAGNRVDFHVDRQVLPSDTFRKLKVKGQDTLEKIQLF